MADWVTISSLATAGGTLVLAGATFMSVRSANRAARVAELSLLAGLRPLLVPSHLDDAPEKVGFIDGKWVRAPGGGGVAEVTDKVIYLVLALRNVGGSFYDFELRLQRGTQSERLVAPPDDWGGRALRAWAERLTLNRRFDDAAHEYVVLARVIDDIYASAT